MTRYFMQSWKSHLCDTYVRAGDEGALLKEVVDLLGQENVYRGVPGAKYLIAKRATRMHFSKQLPLPVVKELRFVSRENPTPKFVDNERLDGQTLRGALYATRQSSRNWRHSVD